ncbi:MULTISPECIES: hypothetical protein [unclassified Ensifer]|uniref:hypothetical protein n=1 Tax=unclassified Ensifer TaxID=2633371 RepID=UPI00081357AE|nr:MULTISPECIES: hypothetical protein [unclassified Ensifer]OCP02817.1 hypothetical protein BC362_02130 [Ensifer sp. LC14]OCP13718.1 hypothetical protein BC374_12170 [Ensifer sp. LC13]OCP14262.1 hypothetical protein BBX50_12450 [Ensifer sp. LC11]OCP29081.1 hypothetical protein BC364_10570 [Ensifer sp. LC499]
MTARLEIVRPEDSPSPSTPAKFVADPLFAEALRRAAVHMVAMHDATPRIVRYTASLRKWLITQAILALHFERRIDPSRSELTAAKLVDFIVASNVASKNTAVAHLAEMRNYRLLIDAKQHADKRTRPLILSDLAEDLIRQWFDGHLSSLDTLDQGGRLAQSQSEPALMHYALPRATRRLIGDRAWRDPPESVATLVWAESGSNILHDLVARLPTGVLPDGRILVGPLKLSDITNRYLISRSHAQRIFARARELGVLGWEGFGNRGPLWISRGLIDDYRHWQAVKFAALDEAFAWATTQTR